LVAGAFLAKNYKGIFGVDPDMPSENESSRAYSQVQVLAIWAHAVLLFGMAALLVY
jgi:hypothetical protein